MVSKLTSIARQANQERYEAHSKENLKDTIQRKFKTTMIGALSVFEESFGYLWGHGIDERDLTEEELEMKKVWEVVRTEILNKGNNQARAAMSEIDQHTVKYNKMQYQFVVQKSGNKE